MESPSRRPAASGTLTVLCGPLMALSRFVACLVDPARREYDPRSVRVRVRTRRAAGHLPSVEHGDLGDPSDGSSRPATEHVLAALFPPDGLNNVEPTKLEPPPPPPTVASSWPRRRVSPSSWPYDRRTCCASHPSLLTDNGGTSWTTGLLSEGLAATPSSLSIATTGRTLALVDRGLAGSVLASRGTFSSWQTLTTARRLASVSGEAARASCSALSAVASSAGGPLVGAECSRPGAVGIFGQQRRELGARCADAFGVTGP